MKVRENQNFLSLYFEPRAVETAVGGADPHADAATWKRETRSLGQVPTPAARRTTNGPLGYVGETGRGA